MGAWPPQQGPQPPPRRPRPCRPRHLPRAPALAQFPSYRAAPGTSFVFLCSEDTPREHLREAICGLTKKPRGGWGTRENRDPLDCHLRPVAHGLWPVAVHWPEKVSPLVGVLVPRSMKGPAGSPPPPCPLQLRVVSRSLVPSSQLLTGGTSGRSPGGRAGGARAVSSSPFCRLSNPPPPRRQPSPWTPKKPSPLFYLYLSLLFIFFFFFPERANSFIFLKVAVKEKK